MWCGISFCCQSHLVPLLFWFWYISLHTLSFFKMFFYYSCICFITNKFSSFISISVNSSSTDWYIIMLNRTPSYTLTPIMNTKQCKDNIVINIHTIRCIYVFFSGFINSSMYVYMYIYVCMYICIYACMHVCMYVCMCVFMYVCYVHT